MPKKNVPALRLHGFSGEWENEAVGAFSRLLPHNSLSREQLTDLDTGVSNVHYGDILVKLTAVTTPDGLPFAKDATQFQYLTGHFLNDGDVVFADAAEDLTVGKCTEVQDIGNKKVVAGLHTIPIHPMRSFGKAFLGYAFNADSFHNRLIPRVQGTKVSSISARTLLETELSIPPTLEEQQTIGAIFTNLDAAINQHTLKHKALQQAKTALMQRMFPQEGQTLPELRLEGYSGEWKPVTFGELSGRTYGGGTPSSDEPSYWTGDIPWIQSSDVAEEGVAPVVPRKHITREAISRSATMQIPANSVAIVTRVGVGKVSFMPYSYATSQDFVSLSDLSGHPEYIALTVKRRMEGLAGQLQGSTIKGITKVELLNQSVHFPPTLEEQQSIGAVFSRLDALIAAEAQYVASLKQAKTALLQRMFI